MISHQKAFLLLRLALAFALLYAGIDGFLHPTSWIGFVPDFVEKILLKETFLLIWSIVQVVLGVWLVTGKKIFIPSVLSFAAMVVLLITNWQSWDIIFRDVPIAVIALVLALYSYRKA